MDHLFVSVVIPVLDGEDTIEACLHSLRDQTVADLEVIIVDNGSADRTLEKIELFSRDHGELDLKIISESKRGPSACRNAGVRVSKGEVVCFTDADCVTDSNWIRDVLEGFRTQDVGAVAGNIFGYRPGNIIQQFLSLYTLRGLPEDQTFERYTLTEGGFATANLSVRKGVFDAIGGFDETMRYGEDHDLCARIMASGHTLRYLKNGVVRHIHRGTFPGFVRQSYFTGVGHAHLLRKYGTGVFLTQIAGRTFRKEPCLGRVWINGVSADKKFIGLCALWLWVSWGWLAPVFYLLFLTVRVSQQAERSDMVSPFSNSVLLAVLLIVKSFSLTLGRWMGSVHYRVLCL